MMQSFLMAAHEEKDNVVMIWIKQVRDVAYDSEDRLQEFSIHLQKPTGWRFPSTLRKRHHIAMQMKGLRARVDDVSQRNLGYQPVSGTLTPSLQQMLSSLASQLQQYSALMKDGIGRSMTNQGP